MNRPLIQRPHIRIIGDVHGRIVPRQRRADRDKDRRYTPAIWRDPRIRGRSYSGLVSEATHSIQVGDLALDYAELMTIDPKFHRVIAGNHDNLGRLSSHFLGDFGTYSIPLQVGSFDFFYARGAASIDRMHRVEGLNWWSDEELNETESAAAIARYIATKPKIVISHDCPSELVSSIATLTENIPWSATNRMLQTMFDAHQPAWWFFGHHHRNWVFQHPSGTRFVCLGSLAFFDFDADGKSISCSPE